MFESNIVRFVIIPIYTIMAIFIIYLILKNSAADDALKNSSIAIASLLPVFIALLPYLNIHEEKHSLIFNLVYDSEEKQIITGDFPNSYDSTYSLFFTNLPEESLKLEKVDELLGKKGIDLIEKGIVTELLINFSSHWDFETTKQETPIGENVIHKRSSENLKKLNLDDVKKLFSHNKIINTEGVMVGDGLSIPPDSNLTISATDQESLITIINKKTKITIQIIPTMLCVIQNGLNGIIKPDPDNNNRYYIISYNVNINFQPKRFEQFSPETKKYKNWFNNIVGILKKLTWEEVAAKNKQRLIDSALKKILDSKTVTSTTDNTTTENIPNWKLKNIP